MRKSPWWFERAVELAGRGQCTSWLLDVHVSPVSGLRRLGTFLSLFLSPHQHDLAITKWTHLSPYRPLVEQIKPVMLANSGKSNAMVRPNVSNAVISTSAVFILRPSQEQRH